jgi:mannosyltransferase
MINWLMYNSPLFYWTQSLWRDEAFSVWIAQGSVAEVIKRTSGDFNPPLYYLLLHFWMQVFGKSEIALRGLSIVFFLIFIFVIYQFSQKIFHTKTWAIYTTLLMAINPMLVYFAFEVRMYSLLFLTATASMYFLFTKKNWWYVLCTILGMYTQPFMLMVVIAQAVYLFINKQYKFLISNMLLIFLAYIPWIWVLFSQFQNTGPMWMWPVNLNLLLAVLGNLYFGYEGTPWYLWGFMQFFSIGLAILYIKSLKHKYHLSIKNNYKNLLFCWLFIPLIIVLGVSLIKPIYVHRYVVYVVPAEIFLLTIGITQIKRKQLLMGLAAFILLFTFATNFILVPDFHRKVNVQSTFEKIKTNIKTGDIIISKTPLIFYESLYYAPPTNKVLLYNPNRIHVPRYVGSEGMPETVWINNNMPLFPNRAFIVNEDGTFQITSQISSKYASF